ITKVETACNMIVVRYTIADDLGGYVENGIEWGEGNSFRYWKKLRTDGNGLGVIMNPTGEVTFRAWAKTVSGGIMGYSETQTASPAAEPEPYDVSYEEITPDDVPSEIKVYTAHTTVTGRPLNIWYATADITTGNVVMRTLCPNGYAKTSSWPKTHTNTPYVFTNGGYFYTTSLSYVLDQGEQKSDNMAMDETNQYPISRGVFGVTADGTPSVCWRYGGISGGGPYFYDTPIPQISGAAALEPSSTFPSPAIDPDYYNAIGGGPVLVKDGKTVVNFIAVDESKSDSDKQYISNFEVFPTNIFNKSELNPRTAIGNLADGRIVLMVVDGRNKGVSEGVVLTELARLMTGVGCVNALNLDGGGSSVFCAGQDLNILNRPSSNGTERSVISMVGFAKPE
ncbi:MAG: phosphodiester glycosidase family protein, partial [Bacteroidales bacterium]|nr:phosphodiester glycosidase family protein [Bacteroidales bacterium]